MIIKNGAVFIADAHYGTYRKELELLIDSFLQNPPPQLFLAGDIFDLLIGTFSYLIKINNAIIVKLNTLSEKTEVFYFEGNHDFLLQNILSNKIHIFPISKQPVIFEAFDKKILLSHGDYNDTFSHTVYSYFIRNKFFLKILHLFTFNFFNNWFLKKIIKNLQKKKICKQIDNFATKHNFNHSSFNVDIVVEGHYHQDIMLKKNNKIYINLPAFACNKSYIVVKFSRNLIEFEKTTLRG
jgi:UDP-2,3-diacylglucosamine hydrolase